MAISDFIPEIWSARLQRHLDRNLVYAQQTVCNRDWEGEISEAGDTVHIQKIGDPEIKTYVPGEDMAAAEEATGTTQTLVVDQFRYFNVSIDDVNKAQVNVNALDAFATRAGVKMAQTIDAFVASKLTAAATTNKVGTDAAPTEVKADGTGDFTPYELAVELRRLLAGQDAPLDSLWLAISPDFEAEIQKDPNYIGSGSEIGAQFVRNGAIGQIAGFEVLRTTGVPTSEGSGETKVANEKILAGAGNYATTFASQITETKAYEPELRFGDAVKGLDVYGAKVLEPATVAQAHVKSL
jgi:N4-gp56 family major capsid protein